MSLNTKLIIFLMFVGQGFGSLIIDDLTFPTDGSKITLNNNGFAYSITSSGSMSETQAIALPIADGSAGQQLTTNGSNVWSWTDPTGGIAGAHTMLNNAGLHTNTAAGTTTRGGLMYVNATPLWAELPIGAANTFLKSDGTDFDWEILDLGTDTTGNYVLSITDGLAIDGGDGGSEGAALTIAFDPTELLGNRTWGDASTDTIVWTWARATGTDPTMTFGNDFISLNGDLKILGDDLFMITNTDKFLLVADGTNFNPVESTGDVIIDNTGVATVQANAVALTTDTTGNYVASVATTSPINGGAGGSEGATLTITIDDADDDGSTKGAASFDNTDFNATSGNVTIVDDGHSHTASSISGFMLDAGTPVDNSLVRFDGTDGFTTQTTDITVADNGDLSLAFADIIDLDNVDASVDPAANADAGTVDAQYSFEGVLTELNGGTSLVAQVSAPTFIDRGPTKALISDGTEWYEATGYVPTTGNAKRAISFMIKVPVAQTGNTPLVEWGDDTTNYSRWGIWVIPTHKIIISLRGAFVTGSVSLNDNEWHHILVTHDGNATLETANTKLIIDGVDDPLTGTGEGKTLVTGNVDLTVFASPVPDIVAQAGVCIDELAIYVDGTMPALTEALNIYNRQKPRTIRGTSNSQIDWTDAWSDLYTEGSGYFGGNLGSDGDLSVYDILCNDITTVGDIEVGGDLDVDGTGYFAENLEVTGNIDANDIFCHDITVTGSIFGGSGVHVREDEGVFYGDKDDAVTRLGKSADDRDVWMFELLNDSYRMLLKSPTQLIMEVVEDIELHAEIFSLSITSNGENMFCMSREGIEFFEGIAGDPGQTFAIENRIADGFVYDRDTSSTTIYGGDITFDSVTYDANFPGGGTHVIGTFQAGDGGTTDYVEIEVDGDMKFLGGAGLPFGEICYHDGGFNVVLAAQDTDYQIVGFNTDGNSNGNVTPDNTNDHITVGDAGMYLVGYSVSSRSTQSNKYQYHVKYNNGATDIPCSYTHRDTTVASKLGVAANTSIVDLPASATVELWVQRIDGGAVSKTITIEQVNFNVIQIGGT